MGLVSTWLRGIGLSSAVPRFQAAGIVSPEALAELDVTHFEGLGISDADDRRKLFLLVERIKVAVNSEKKKKKENLPRRENSRTFQEQVESVINGSSSIGNGEPQPGRSVPESPFRIDISDEEDIQEDNYQSRNDRAVRRSQRLASKTHVVPTSPVGAKENRVSINNRTTKSPKSSTMPQRIESGMSSRNEEKKVEARSIQYVGSAGSDDDDDAWVNERGDEDIISHMSSKKSSVTEEDISASNSRRGVSNGASKTSTTRQNQMSRFPSSSTASSSVQLSPKSDSDSTNDSKPSKSAPVSRMQAPRARRPQSRLPNPTSKSTRTGKQLSAIPSEAPAPMSPLVPFPQAQMDEDLEATQIPKKKEGGRKKNRRRRTFSGDSDSLDHLLQSEESSDMSDSDSRLETDSDTESQSGSVGMVDKRLEHEFNMAESADLDGKARRLKHGRRSLNLPRGTSGGKAKSFGGPVGTFVHGGTEDTSFKSQIARLREDNTTEHELFSSSIAFGESDYDMRIRVIVRKRPVSKSEQNLTGGVDVIHPLDYGEYGRILVYQPKTRVDLTKEIETIPFSFDNVFDEDSTNVGIYDRSIRNLIGPFFAGQWSTIFAYGQTGSGKTYTMMGSNMTGMVAGTSVHDESNLGLYYLAALDIFEMLERPEFNQLSVGVSLFEIYGGKLFDLLNDRRQVKCLEDRGGKICFPGLTEHPVFGPDQLMDLIEEGAANRSTGTTSRNADSSRSHAVLQLNLRKTVGRKKSVQHGRLTFIDLAGSERGADTNSASRATRLEGAEINTSLLALKEVIRALATGGSMTHIPFRGSKLTQVLKDSFVGKNSRCCMVACISPDIGNCDQTLNTLRYADRVKERNPESGALASKYEQPTKVPHMTFSGQSRLPPSIEATHSASSASSDSQYDGYPDESFMGNNENEDPHGHNDFLSVISDSDTAVLDDLLMASPQEQTNPASSKFNNLSAKRRAGEALVAEHRAIMSTMLAMVKDEMTLANVVDGDRDKMDDYILELERIQETQLRLISKLRGALHDYVSAAEGDQEGGRERAGSEESFEDLRD